VPLSGGAPQVLTSGETYTSFNQADHIFSGLEKIPGDGNSLLGVKPPTGTTWNEEKGQIIDAEDILWGPESDEGRKRFP